MSRALQKRRKRPPLKRKKENQLVKADSKTTLAVADADDKKKKTEINLIKAEEKIEGDVGFQDYRDLFSFSIGGIGIVIYWSFAII